MFFKGLPPLVFPPWGWSIGFIASPLTIGLLPSHLDAPAFPNLVKLFFSFETLPSVAQHWFDIVFTSSDGSCIMAPLSVLPNNVA